MLLNYINIILTISMKKILKFTPFFSIPYTVSSSPLSTLVAEQNILNSNVLGSLIENFETLSGIKQLAVSLLLLNAGLVSSLCSIVFIYLGDYLLTKYNLEAKYPKLAIIIKMRQKFKKYYLYLNVSFIFIIILTQVIFSLAILML